MDFYELAAKRYSCRKFSDKKVDPALVEKIIATALHAPTAVNHQPFRLFWMKSPESQDILKQVTKYTFGADTFLVLGTCQEECWVRPYDNRPFADVDGSIVGTHIMMQIEDLGLSTTWVGYFDAPLLKSLCPAMEPYDLIAIFPIGYAAEDAAPGHLHSKRRSSEEIVTIL